MLKKFIAMFTIIFPAIIFAASDESSNNYDTSTNWTQFQGNAQHTGYVPITVNPKLFKLDWSKQLSSFYNSDLIYSGTLVVVNNNLVLSGCRAEHDCYLLNLNPNNGSTTWEISLPNSIGSSITYDNNKIFTSTIDIKENTLTYAAYDINDGKQLYRNTLLATLDFIGFIPNDNILYLITHESIYAINENDGTIKWKQMFSYGSPPAYPTIGDGVIYAFPYKETLFEPTQLVGLNVNDGSMNTKISLTDYSSLSNELIYDRNNKTLIYQDFVEGLHIVDLQTMLVKNFKDDEGSLSNPVVANNIIYYLTQESAGYSEVASCLKAFDEKTNEILWKLKLPSFTWTPVITNNILFTSGFHYTYAIDLTTHQIVWPYPVGGELAIAQNHLFIVKSDSVYAIRLN